MVDLTALTFHAYGDPKTQKGPQMALVKWVPMGTFFSFKVPIYFLGPHSPFSLIKASECVKSEVVN